MRDSFYIVINENTCIYVAHFQDDEFWPVKSMNMEDQAIEEFLDQEIKLNPFKREIMSPFITNIIHELQKCTDKNGELSSET